MARLALGDLSRLLTFAGDIYGVRDLDAFPRALVLAVRRLVPCDMTTYNEVDLPAGTIRYVAEPELPRPAELVRAFEAHMAEHPLIVHQARTRDGRTLKISDFLTRARFHDLGLYTEVYRHLDVEHQMATIVPARPPLVIGVALNRSLSDFSERERLILDVARPHLVQAYRNARALTEMQSELRAAGRALENDGGVVFATAEGRILRLSASAERWLEHYFPARPRPRNRLPDALCRWLAYQLSASSRDTGLPPPREPLVVEDAGRRLVVRHLSGDAACLLLLREQVTALDPAALERLGLTRREAEVLAWLAQGKTNPEIATILGVRPRTVGKHLERVYQKLGVETRTAAALAAREAVLATP